MIICLSVLEEIKLFQIVVTWTKWWECLNISMVSWGNVQIFLRSQGLIVKKGCPSGALWWWNRIYRIEKCGQHADERGRRNLLHVGTNTPLFFSSPSLGCECECECVSVMQDLSSPTRDRTHGPAVEAPSPNPWDRPCSSLCRLIREGSSDPRPT